MEERLPLSSMDVRTPNAVEGYLSDHLAGAAAAIQLLERCVARDPDSGPGQELQALLGDIEDDKRVLERVLEAAGGSPKPFKRASALGMELLANFRMSLPVLGPGSPETARLEEIETLCLGIEGKRLMWRAIASADTAFAGFDFEDLERRAEAQRDRLERFRLQLASTAFGASSAG
jgi:hypothetical protein